MTPENATTFSIAPTLLPTTVNTTSAIDPDKGSGNISFAIAAFILCIVFLLGVPGNLFIIWSILARARKRSVTTLIILNLACADGTIMSLTVFFVIYLAKQSWVFGNFMCKLLFYLCNTNMYASIMLIMLMSLHRLVAVMWPHSLSFVTRRRNVLTVLGGLWVLVFALALPALIFRQQLVNTTDRKVRLLCSANHTKQEYLVFQYTTETVVGFLFPYGIIVSSYVCILRRLKQTKFRGRVRSENLIHAIIITFAIFWLPYHVVNILQVVASCNDKLGGTLGSIVQSSRVITSSLAFISSCVNPVLYTFAGRSYIKDDGLAFMARLFEGTALDSNAKKILQAGQEAGIFPLKTSGTEAKTEAK